LSELELYERCFSFHPSCHHLQSELVDVEDMDMLEVEGLNMVKEHDHPSNHRLRDEGLDMADIHMVEVDVWIWWRSGRETTDRRWRV
jgi:hypothetical protein